MLAGATANDTVELWDLASARTRAGRCAKRARISRTSTSAPTVRFGGGRRQPEAGEGPREDAHPLRRSGVRLWTLDSFGPAGEPFAKGAERVAFAPEGRGLFVADGGLSRWKAGAPQPEQAVAAPGVSGFALSRDGKRLATFGVEGVILWNLASAGTSAAPAVSVSQSRPTGLPSRARRSAPTVPFWPLRARMGR